jgi:hypothetical protein
VLLRLTGDEMCSRSVTIGWDVAGLDSLGIVLISESYGKKELMIDFSFTYYDCYIVYDPLFKIY